MKHACDLRLRLKPTRQLKRTGAVRSTDEGHVRCRSSSTASGVADSAFLLEFAQRLHEFGSAMAAAAEVGENRVFYGFREADISQPDLARLFRATFADRAASLLDGADRWVASRQRQRPPRGRVVDAEAQPVNVRLGVFLADSRAPARPASAAPTSERSRKARGSAR